jgi:beta-RFAP synthase
MVEHPGIEVCATDADTWSAQGPLAERALPFALRLAHSVQADHPRQQFSPQRLTVKQAAPEHVGLGTGTQLGLAIARAVAMQWGIQASASDLARRLGRGLRSALGIHGFEQGGFLVEAGKRSPKEVAPLIARVAFPATWRIVLVMPAGGTGLHGTGERDAFTRLIDTPLELTQTDVLCRLVLLGMLPALVEEDLEAFGEALFDFNARVGEVFAPVQGGLYAGARQAEMVSFLRGKGVRGVGQSSWGPTIFAVVGDEGRAADLVDCIRRQFGLRESEVLVTRACNHGATVE